MFLLMSPTCQPEWYSSNIIQIQIIQWLPIMHKFKSQLLTMTYMSWPPTYFPSSPKELLVIRVCNLKHNVSVTVFPQISINPFAEVWGFLGTYFASEIFTRAEQSCLPSMSSFSLGSVYLLAFDTEIHSWFTFGHEINVLGSFWSLIIPKR